jgi:peptidoglycan/LPS O-acetylase OafA/YrhL
MPGLALAAGIIGIVGAVPLMFVAVLAVALGGLSADTGPDPWTYLLILAPLLEVFGAVWLLARRSWLPLVLALVPTVVLTVAVIVTAAGQDSEGLGWPLLLVAGPAVAAALALAPSVRRWTAGRPRRTR